jgi:hypothetical protein
VNGWQIIQFYTEPEKFALCATASNWTEIINDSRDCGLLASLFNPLQKVDFENKSAVLSHVQSSIQFADKQYQTLVRELAAVEPVFAGCGYSVLLVKGVAYRLAGFEYARYRVFSDIDILVAADCLQDAVKRLQNHGFMEQVESEYEKHYFIGWSHQYPPLRHFIRSGEIDLHHTIFFAKSRVSIDIQTFIGRAIPVKNSVFYLPSTADMFVHACLHLFYQEENQKLTKDLIDLHCLYKQIVNKQQISHAAEICNQKSAIAYGIYVQQWLFKEEISDHEQQFILQHCHKLQLAWLRFLLRSMLNVRLLPRLFSDHIWFLRGHLIKMNFTTLAYHVVMRLFNTYQINKRHSAEQKKLDAQSLPEDAR